MKGFGHGTSRQINEVQALKAAQAEPRIIANEYRQYALIGQTVSIAPADYGCEPTTGVLVGVMPNRWIIARQDAELGTLHIHFPRQGYQLTAI